MCAFFVKLMILDQILIVLVKFSLEKIFLDVRETYSWTKSSSDSHNSACFFDIILPTCQGRFYFSTEHKLVALRRLMFCKDIRTSFQ